MLNLNKSHLSKKMMKMLDITFKGWNKASKMNTYLPISLNVIFTRGLPEKFTQTFICTSLWTLSMLLTSCKITFIFFKTRWDDIPIIV